VHPLARIVEGRCSEAVTEQERGDDDDTRDGGGNHPTARDGDDAAGGADGDVGRGAGRTQVRDTSATPATMRPIPTQRVAVTGSARTIWASTATTM
jgi:hypothetical protein